MKNQLTHMISTSLPVIEAPPLVEALPVVIPQTAPPGPPPPPTDPGDDWFRDRRGGGRPPTPQVPWSQFKIIPLLTPEFVAEAVRRVVPDCGRVSVCETPREVVVTTDQEVPEDLQQRIREMEQISYLLRNVRFDVTVVK